MYRFACVSKRLTPSNFDLLALFVIISTAVSLCEMTIFTTQNNYRKKKKNKNRVSAITSTNWILKGENMGLANGPFLAAGEYARRENIREREREKAIRAPLNKRKNSDMRHNKSSCMFHRSTLAISEITVLWLRPQDH